jgi:hypothetical protein
MNADTPTPETDSAYIQCPNEGAWDFRIRQEKTMAKLERERDEARERIKNNPWCEACSEPDCCVSGDGTCAMIRKYLLAKSVDAKLATVTEQRDRLAEAVNAATVLIAAKGRHNTMLAYEGLRSALSPKNA